MGRYCCDFFAMMDLMKRVILFSTITSANSTEILSQIFSNELGDLALAYMPSDGIANSAIYIEEWRAYAKKFGASFTVIDNHSPNAAEKQKLLDANILVISGGNTFALLHNLRTSGLDKTIIEFAQKPNVILSGFSAGAIVLSPTIAICNLPNFDENIVGLTDLRGLGIVDFEIFPHYVEASQLQTLEDYRATTSNQVKQISDEEYIVVDL